MRLRKNGLAMILSLVLTLVVSWVTVPIIMTALGHTQNSKITTTAIEAREAAEAGIAEALMWIKNGFTYNTLPANFPKNPSEVGPGFAYDIWPGGEAFPAGGDNKYAVNVELTLATNNFIEGVDGNGEYRYILTSSGTVPTLGGEIEKTVQAAVTFDYYYGDDIDICTVGSGQDCTRDLGYEYVNDRKPIIHLDTTNEAEGRYVRPGFYSISYNGEYDIDQGAGAETTGPDREYAMYGSENMVVYLDEAALLFPEWRDLDGNGRASYGGEISPEEFLVKPWLQDYTVHLFENIDANGTNDDPPFNFEVIERDPENPEDRFIIELFCESDSLPIGSCSGDLDLESGSTCSNFCEAVEDAYTTLAWPDYEAACMAACGRNVLVEYSFQDEHPDSEANVRCGDSQICLIYCAHSYQWNYYDSYCRQICDVHYNFDPNAPNYGLRQSRDWNECMVDCSDFIYVTPGFECQNWCDDHESCMDFFSEEYQMNATEDNPAQFIPAVDPRQFMSQCDRMCKSVDNIGECRSSCDRRFFRQDVTGDIVITLMNKLAKEKRKRFHWNSADDNSYDCEWPCEPITAGSVHFGDAEGTAFELQINDDLRIILKDFQWIEIPNE